MYSGTRAALRDVLRTVLLDAGETLWPAMCAPAVPGITLFPVARDSLEIIGELSMGCVVQFILREWAAGRPA